MYYPPLFTPVRPFDPRANSLEVPVGRENPLDLSVKTIRPSSEATAGGADADDLLMLEHRKLASLAASHSLSAMGRQLLDPSLYRLGYGAEAGAVIPGLAPPFCFDRTTGVAVPTSLAGHQLMSSFLQQRERLEQQQQAFYAARNSAVAQQQAAVAAAAAAYMDPAALPLHLRNGLTQREAAAALAATRGLYTPALPTPMVLPAFSLFTEDKGAFTSLRHPVSTTAAEKSFLNGVAGASQLEAARYAEQLQRLREQHLQQHQATGKCSNACCASGALSGLGQTPVPCACCPSQSALCARSPMGCATKDPTSAATGKVCDFPQTGLNFLHRPTATTTAATTTAVSTCSELRLSVSSLCTTQTSTEPTTVSSSRDKHNSALRAPSIWNAGLPSVSNGGKTAFSVPKKKENRDTSLHSSKEHRSSGSIKDILKDNQNNNSNSYPVSKCDAPKINSQPIKTENSKKSNEKISVFLNEDYTSRYYQRDPAELNFNVHKTSFSAVPKFTTCNPAVNGNDSLTTVTSITPIVPTRCEGGSIPVTKMPPLLEAVRPSDLSATTDQSPDIPSSVSSPQGPPPLIAVSNGTDLSTSSIIKSPYISQEIPASMRVPSSLYPNIPMTMPSYKHQSENKPIESSINKTSVKSPKKPQPSSKYNGVPIGFVNGEVPIAFPKPIPSKPIPHLPTSHVSPNATQFSSHYRPAQHQMNLQNHNDWIPHANPNVTIAPHPQPVTTSSVTTTSSASVANIQRPNKIKQLNSHVNVKRETEYADTANVLQSLLIRSAPGTEPLTSLPPATLQEPIGNVITSSTNLPLFGIDYRYPHLNRQMNLTNNGLDNLPKTTGEGHTTIPCPTTVITNFKSEVKTESLNCSSSKHKKRPSPVLNNEENGASKKRILSPEFNMPVPRYSFQPALYANEANEAPECPYTFIPDPPLNFSGQIKTEDKSPWRGMLSKHMNVPAPCDISKTPALVQAKSPSKPIEHPWAPKVAAFLPNRNLQHVNQIVEQPITDRLSAIRARRKLRRKLLARIYQQRRPLMTGNVAPDREMIEKQLAVRYARKLLSQLTLRWAHRRYIHKWYAIKRKSIGGVLRLQRKKKNGKVVYKIRRAKVKEEKGKILTEDEIQTKSKDSNCSIPIPAEMKRLMVNKALGETPLHRAARLGYPEAVAYCLQTKCVSVNARDNAGYTPLHECCSRGHLDIARALLQYGADVNASAAGGIRPLHDAVENDHVEIVRLLLSYGADPTIATYSGLEPMKLARSAMMAEFLQGFFADISGELDIRPHLPWRFWGSAKCLDPEDCGYDIFNGVPSDSEGEGEGDNDFLFEVSDSPHLPTFRLLFPASNNKAQCNYLRLDDVLRKLSTTKEEFLRLYGHIEILSLPRHEFEASATCSPLLTGKMDPATRPNMSRMFDNGSVTDLVKLDNSIRKVLGIETISVR
ncbi:uncharacterized protein [Parasteatoda tepidariorum]|uniref:uncharacterized protein n=1 Tax=Parasteatoda tepidariorum TaxID=114398 RepID=UPI00077F8F0B|nr:uncharacterized protein LOC107437564 [Parasteatoda tepidariorum]